MQLIKRKPSGFKEAEGRVIEVKLWEAFLTYDRHNLYNTLCTYSLDNAPLEKENSELATVSFRFMTRDWDTTLKNLLELHNVPVIKENRLEAAH